MMKNLHETSLPVGKASAMVILFYCLLSTGAWAQKIQVQELKTEYQKNPMGIDAAAPRLSWKISANHRNVMQDSYQVRVGKDSINVKAGKGLIWDTGLQKNEQSVLLPYTGPSLESGVRYYWQVKVKDKQGKESPWSEIQFWQMGLLNKSDWTAQWIGAAPTDTLAGPSPIFRKAFPLDGKIRSATLHITAYGVYEAMINGKRVGKDYMAPGWTSYNDRLLYQNYEVTDLLKTGQNVIGFSLGDGWYRGRLGRE